MAEYHQQVQQAADYIRRQWDVAAAAAVITGTGLGRAAEGIQIDRALAYREVPHFPLSTVSSHAGRLLLGHLGALPLVVLQGRFHLYEGYSPLEVTFPIRVLQVLGVRRLILSNASGGLRQRFKAGQLMIIRDHINLTGANPLVGPNREQWGVRFPDMSAAYSEALRGHARAAAAELGIPVAEGVYAGLPGPSLETPAEVRYLQTIGADAVGFSTVQEVIAAVHGGLQVLGLSILTNVHTPDAPQAARLEEIIAVAQEAAPRVNRLIRAILVRL